MLGQHARAYAETQVRTADTAQLLLLLYDAALRHLAQADEAEQRRDFAAKCEHLTKVQDIIFELRGGIDFGAGELAQRLDQLYLYMLRRLLEGTTKRDDEALQEVSRMLRDLREAWWQALMKPPRQGAGMPPAAAMPAVPPRSPSISLCG
ncbi:MAG: flagellar export chaperone FliS [Candidatus Tectomicrobia bacterium]|nr:flagellar export chaperone FliS [Candidatus Tectomicrobia bacterium]